jgi:hypothetical protein
MQRIVMHVDNPRPWQVEVVAHCTSPTRSGAALMDADIRVGKHARYSYFGGTCTVPTAG